MIEIDRPEVVAEVRAVFETYETALVGNDVETLDALFFDAPTTIRYGGGENLYGYGEIAAFRAARPSVGLARRIDRTVITTYGTDLAVASTLFFRDAAPGKVGRQMQTWLRTDAGWKVVAAHVSLIADPDASSTPASSAAPPQQERIEIVVVGAHLSGMALNGELAGRGGRFEREAQTTADYRLYALAGGPPARPGLVRVADGTGAAVATEVWSLPLDGFARFVAAIPAPLGLATVRLADGTAPKGFICETEGLAGARDITGFGGWRAYVSA